MIPPDNPAVTDYDIFISYRTTHRKLLCGLRNSFFNDLEEMLLSQLFTSRFMKRDPLVYLWGVRKAAETVDSFVGDKKFTDYEQNDMLRSAVERRFEITKQC